VRRLAPLALAVLAVVALATVATSLDSVSTEPTIDTEDPTLTVKTVSGGGSGSGTGTSGPEGRDQPTRTEIAAESDGGGADVPLWQVVVGLALFLVGSAVALYGLTRGEDEGDTGDGRPDPEPTAPSADSVVLGSAVPASNDVYRAWAALCGAVPLDPDGQTPADVAEAAVAAGHPPAAVAALTDAFCAVRYGDAAPTSEREARARTLASELSLDVEGEP